MALNQKPGGDQLGVWAGLHYRREVASMVNVIVGEEYPADIARIDDREHIFEPLLAVCRRARIDNDRLLTLDHERVHIDIERPDNRLLHLLDKPGVVGALERGVMVFGLDRGKRHSDFPPRLIGKAPASTAGNVAPGLRGE